MTDNNPQETHTTDNADGIMDDTLAHDDLMQAPEGFYAEDRSIALNALPAWVLWLSLELIIMPMVIFLVIVGFDRALEQDFFTIWSIVGVIILLLAHEGIHALVWKTASGLAWSNFTFGVMWKALAPYCHAKQPMNLTAYRIGAIAPVIVTGIVPFIFALLIQNTAFALVASLLISGGVGDIYVLWRLRDLPADVLVRDHPSQAGSVVYLPIEHPQ